jgi:hypothetical protein
MTSRSYTWQCESANELYQFLQNLIKVYVKYTRGNMPQLTGIEYHETCKLQCLHLKQRLIDLLADSITKSALAVQ